MAKKQAVNKTQAVRDYLKSNPEAKSKEITAALKKQGIQITPAYVAGIKTKINKEGKAKKAARKRTPVEAVAPAVAEKPAKANGTITLEQIKKVAQTIRTMGSYQRMTEVLEVIKEVGGVKKFKDLAEAMMIPAAEAVPF